MTFPWYLTWTPPQTVQGSFRRVAPRRTSSTVIRIFSFEALHKRMKNQHHSYKNQIGFDDRKAHIPSKGSEEGTDHGALNYEYQDEEPAGERRETGEGNHHAPADSRLED